MTWKKIATLLVPLIFVLALWQTDTVSVESFEYNVSRFTRLPQLETHWLYFILLAITAVPIIFLSFDSRVSYFKSWKYLFPATAIVATFFIIWDVIFTNFKVWGFNDQYHTSVNFLGLPLEECLFFFCIPFAWVFIYENIRKSKFENLLKPFDKAICLVLGLTLVIAGLWQYEKLYTSTTFLLTGALLLFHYQFISSAWRSSFFLAYLISWIPFLLIDGALTGGFTDQPVVLYHPAEYLGIRIISIPFEDAVYSLLLLLSIVTIMEKFRERSANQNAILAERSKAGIMKIKG